MGWTTYIWRIDGVDPAFQDAAVDALNSTLDNQVSTDIYAVDKGVVPGWIQDCGDDSTTLDNFESYLEWNNYVDPGQHHMCIVDCATTGFYSRARGDLTHYPNSNTDYGRSIVNAATGLLGANRFEATVIHEFGHTAIDQTECPYASASEPDREHSCGGIIGGLREAKKITPMLVAHLSDVPYDKSCETKDTNDGYTTEITSCTKNAIDAYH